MYLVNQEIGDGCGVACYAMVTGTNYYEAFGVLHPSENPVCSQTASHETSNEDLLQALRAAGFEIEVRIRPDIRTLKKAVLVVRYRIGPSMYMHTVVWDAERQQVLDPFDDRPFEEYQDGLCLAFELSTPSGLSSSVSLA